jgi:hypothetical protein
MVFTVRDLFQAGLLPPSTNVNPVGGTAAFNYIVARLFDSFDYDDVNQCLSWIQMSDHDTGFLDLTVAHGLAWHEITEEWPKIQADLDGNVLSPLYLVHGQEPATIGLITGIQDLGQCHQVLAWGYDLNGTSLTIYIYDPDFNTGDTGDTNKITLDIGNPAHTTPISVSNWPAGYYRGFFHAHYTYNNPSGPASAAFIGTVITNPGFPNGGPIQNPSPSPWLFNQITFNIGTGDDDLRGDSSATASIVFPSGTQTFILKAQSDPGWANNSETVKTFTIAGQAQPLSAFGAITITLTSHNSFGETDDNWNIQSINIIVNGSSGSQSLFNKTGNPLSRLTGNQPSVTLQPGIG